MQALIKKITTKGFVVLLVSFILLSLLSGLPGETRAYQAQSEANYLVQGKEIELLEDLIPKYGGRVTSRLEIIHSVGAWLPSQAVQALLQESGVLAITCCLGRGCSWRGSNRGSCGYRHWLAS